MLVYQQLDMAHYRQGNPDRAAATYRRTLQQEPDSIPLKSGLAGVLEISGDYGGAVRLFEEILRLVPGNAIAAINLALVLVSRYGDQESLLRAKRLVQGVAYEQHPAMLDTLGWAHYRLGEYEQAVARLQQAVAGMPGMPLFHYHLGMACHKSGDDVLAKRHLQRALEAGRFPGMEEARGTLAVIDRSS